MHKNGIRCFTRIHAYLRRMGMRIKDKADKTKPKQESGLTCTASYAPRNKDHSRLSSAPGNRKRSVQRTRTGNSQRKHKCPGR